MKVHTLRHSLNGFALIAVISVLLLLTMIAVAFLSLSAVTAKTSRIEWAQEEARANARLALMIAIGEVQRDLGPDQRIAVSASILDRNPDTLEIDGVQNRHWTGVMKSTYEQSRNGSPFTFDKKANGLQDARNGLAYEKENLIFNYLVSGNEGGRDRISGSRTYQDALSSTLQRGPEAVEIVSRGSVSNPDDFVLVRKLDTEKLQRTPDGREEYRPKGAYAWWVSADNQKANVGRPDTHRNIAVDPDTGIGIYRLLHPQDAEPFVMTDLPVGQKNRDDRVLTPKTFSIVDPTNRAGVLRNYHAMTGISSSVLANVRDGGLKKNLSAFLHKSDGDSPVDIDDLDPSKTHYIGISRQDRLVGPPNERLADLRSMEFEDNNYHDVAPTFELLWRWAQIAEENRFGYSTIGIRNQTQARAVRGSQSSAGWDNGKPLILRDGIGGNVYDNENFAPADPRNLKDVKITPVITEACIYYNLATYPRGSGSTQEHILRLCLYPRVGLWNPYNVELRLDKPMVLQLFLNGKKCVAFDGGTDFTREIYYGGRQNGNFDGQFGGMIYFQLPAVTIPPGETFIFSMGGAPRLLSAQDFAGNLLQSTAAPSASSYLYKDYTIASLSGQRAEFARDPGRPGAAPKAEPMTKAPRTFRENPLNFAVHGADNYMFMLKYLLRDSTNIAAFANEPLLIYASPSLQAGGGDEYPIAFNTEIPVIQLSGANDVVPNGSVPHPFTRDGFRLRWLRETDSNRGAGPAESLMLQTSALGNWNPRASYILRNPFDNVSLKAPYFHGLYTRDNPSEEMSWSNLFPVQRNGNQTGFPFGEASFGVDRVVAFEIPTREVGIPSLAYLRHLQLSEFVWHPSYAIGSSIADPRIKTTGTIPAFDNLDSNLNGWNRDGFGVTYWSQLFRNIIYEICDDNHVVFDLSYEVNHNLFSEYFLTGATENQIARFAQDPVANPLKNGNLRLWDQSGDPTEDLNDLFRAAGRLMMDGGFDVHSVNKEAWKAFLSTTIDTGYGSENRAAFPRTLSPKGEENDKSEYSTRVFTGFRSLGRPEIDSLAEAVVREVKRRSPFLGMSDFVNRRLTDDDTGRNGAIEAALERSLPNRGQNERFPVEKQEIRQGNRYIAEENRGEQAMQTSTTRLDQKLKPASTGYGTPGYITQGDVLQVVGSGLVARSDTFTVRAYGESKDVNGNVLARAWCEATIQRTPEPIFPDSITGLNPRDPEPGETDFGRRFRIVSFRWLTSDEV